MGLSARLHWPDDVQKLTEDRRAKGFNVIQLVAGLFPDMHPFDPRGANEAGYPWQTNWSSIRPEYFDAADKRLFYLVHQGFTPCIVGAWGYFLPWMGVEKAKAHWRYLVARYGALPVVWCTAGEANLPWYLAKGFPYDDRAQVKGWTEVTRYLRTADPFHRPITIHPTGIGRLSARHAIDDPALLDFDMLQTPHGRRDAVAPTVNTVRQSYSDSPIMPVINGEAAFEMLGDDLPTEWTRRMFWLCLLNGAAGHTYGANGIWQVNRPNDPHGPSPHHKGGVGYGKIPWQEAMQLPGARQVALGKKLFEKYPWPQFRPHPEWATFEKKASLRFEGSQWIWFPEGNPAENAPAEKRLFRRTIVLPQSKTVGSAQLRVTADDRFTAWLNGQRVGSSDAGSETWRMAKQFNNLSTHLKPGTNVIAVAAENMPAGGANPAGLLLHLQIRFSNDELLDLHSDGAWRCANKETPNWETLDFDDTAWTTAKVIANYGAGPWGPIDGSNNDDALGPQSAGIPGVVRIIYVPEPASIILNNLGRGATYSAAYFDPVIGSSISSPSIQADDNARSKCPPPPGLDHDWVLILEPLNKPTQRKSGTDGTATPSRRLLR
jgi:hypothetical protein